jgi:GTP-binding protein Era
MVERETQKELLGIRSCAKKSRDGSRADLEKFGKQIHIELYVKVNKKLEKQRKHVKRFGYNQ